MTEHVIRLADQSDCTVLADIHAACFETVWNERELRNMLSQPSNKGWLLLDGDRVAAFIIIMDAVDDIEILTIATHPDFRRMGMARNLLAKVDETFAEVQEKRWLLEVSEDNDSAINFYESMGFLKVGTRKKYYKKRDGTRLDALIYSTQFGKLEH